MQELLYKPTKNYAILDVNTTGINYFDRILEICIIKVENDEITDVYRRKVNPNYQFTNGKWKKWKEYENLSDLPTIFELKDEIIKFIGRKIIMGYCVDFDVEHLQRDLDSYEFKNNFIDMFFEYKKFGKECCLFPISLENVCDEMCKRTKETKNFDFTDVYDKCLAVKWLFDWEKRVNRTIYKELPKKRKIWREEYLMENNWL